MHTRQLRALEHTRNAPRRVINLTQKDPANATIEAVPSLPLAPNQVCTGFIYQHASAGGGVDYVSLGIDHTRLVGALAAQPRLTAPLAPAYGPGAPGDNWQNYDKQQQSKLERQSSPLPHGPGFLIHVWQGSSFAGSSSTTSLRDPQSTDIVPPRPTRQPAAAAPQPGPPPVDWSARFFYGVTGRPVVNGTRPSAPTSRPTTTASPLPRIRGRITWDFYAGDTIFLRN
jgi:hypothetical protein